MNEIEKEIVLLVEEVPKIKNFESCYNFSFLCFKYFYRNGFFDSTVLREHFTDGRSDGGIDLITIGELSDTDNSLILIQSKSSPSEPTKQEIVDICTKMVQTYENFKKNYTSKYNERLRRILREKIEEIDDRPYTIELHLFFNSKIEEKKIDDILEYISKINSLVNYRVSIFDSEIIKKQIENVKDPKRYVESASLKYSKTNGIIKYEENKGIMINVCASSLKRIYELYKDSGLFEQNFRYYIRQKKIDDNIKQSILKKKKEFWYLNNGIIIGCSEFDFDGYNINLEKFSIINGCQTTTLIGESDSISDKNDFLIHCKIVASDNNQKFIDDIAEASNSQKPIKDRDLKSNRQEQRKLKTSLESCRPPIYMEIKRGAKKKKTDSKWQSITNEYYGQIVLSCFHQQPGVARSLKSFLFSDNATYAIVFQNIHDLDTVKDFLILGQLYDEYNEKTETNDSSEESVLANGKFLILAVISFFIKYFRGQIDIWKIKDIDNWLSEIGKNDLDGSLFREDLSKDYIDYLDSIFSTIVYYLKTLFDQRTQSKQETSVTNFFKRDKRYRDIILKEFNDRILKNKIEFDKVKNYFSSIFIL